MDKLLARWESKGGKYWVELYYNPTFSLANGQTVIDAHYRGTGCGGGIPAHSEAEAMQYMEGKIAAGYFQADANKSPMKRVS